MKGLAKRLTAAVLLTAVSLTATMYSRARPVELRLGFMAGSYWDAPNGNCYAVIDAAVERFEREHPNVHVTYTSGILKRDYSEWLIDQYLLGSEPDVFLVLPEDFGTLCELGALAPLDGCLAQDKEVSDTDFYPAALQSGAPGRRQTALLLNVHGGNSLVTLSESLTVMSEIPARQAFAVSATDTDIYLLCPDAVECYGYDGVQNWVQTGLPSRPLAVLHGKQTLVFTGSQADVLVKPTE